MKGYNRSWLCPMGKLAKTGLFSVDFCREDVSRRLPERRSDLATRTGFQRDKESRFHAGFQRGQELVEQFSEVVMFAHIVQGLDAGLCVGFLDSETFQMPAPV